MVFPTLENARCYDVNFSINSRTGNIFGVISDGMFTSSVISDMVGIMMILSFQYTWDELCQFYPQNTQQEMQMYHIQTIS